VRGIRRKEVMEPEIRIKISNQGIMKRKEVKILCCPAAVKGTKSQKTTGSFLKPLGRWLSRWP